MHIPKLVPTLVASVLSLAPFGRAYAQDWVGKICNDLRNPYSIAIDASGNYVVPPGLDLDQHQAYAYTQYYRVVAIAGLRKAELARKAEDQLSIIELALSNDDPKAKEALAKIRGALERDARQAEEDANKFLSESVFYFRKLCGDVPPPSTITLQPLPGLIPLISVVTAPPAPPAPKGCDALPGTWAWSWGHGNETKGNSVTTITSDHKMSQPDNHGTWSCSGSSVRFNWTHSTDTLTIVDKNTLQGGSNYGDWVRAKRQ
jgi:hypothetical protein